jgi:hypothetical protein
MSITFDGAEIQKQIETLDGEELVRYWLKTLDSFPNIDVRKEFQKWYSENCPEAAKEKLVHAMRQWMDIWGPHKDRGLLCLECRKSEMIIDPDPVAKTRWRCPKCNAKF